MSNTKPRVLVIVPCYNEQESIESVVANILRQRTLCDVILDTLVVNDCSTDRSLEVIQRTGCVYLNLPTNLGIGGAMHAGYKFAWRKGYDIAVQMDGDGQHPANELNKLIQPLIENRADVVIGSRFITREGFQSSAMRRLGIAYFRRLNRCLIKQTIYDSTSGYRAFNRKTLAVVERYYPDEYPEPEAIVQFGLSKLRMLEVPVFMNERQGGVSSINTSRAIYYMIKVTLGIFFIYLRLRNNSTPSL